MSVSVNGGFGNRYLYSLLKGWRLMFLRVIHRDRGKWITSSLRALEIVINNSGTATADSYLLWNDENIRFISPFTDKVSNTLTQFLISIF